MTTTTTDTKRNKELSRIHCLKKDLGLTDDEYRALLKGVTGKDSSKDLDYRERWHVLCEMGRLGNKGKTPEESTQAMRVPGRFPGEPTWPKEKAALGGKIKALLADAKRPWSYVHAMAKRMYGVDLAQWCEPAQLRGIVAALVKDQKRREAKEMKARAEA